MIIDKAFKWPVAARYVIETGEPVGRRRTLAEGDVPSGLRLVSKGAVRMRQPFKSGASLGQRLITQCEKLGPKDGVLWFAQRYGMLQGVSEAGDWESLTLWSKLVKSLSNARRGDLVPVKIGLHELRRTKAGAIALVPNTLKSALECEAFLLGWAGEIKQCLGCGVWFEVGGQSGKRLHAEFHDDDCRYAFHNRVKADFVARNRRAGFTTTEIEKMWGRTKGR